MFQEMMVAGSGGSADYTHFFDNITQTSQSGNNISYTFTVGKTYFIAYSRGGSTPLGVISGATVLSSGTGSVGGNTSYFSIIQATSTTVSLEGTNNAVVLSQID